MAQSPLTGWLAGFREFAILPPFRESRPSEFVPSKEPLVLVTDGVDWRIRETWQAV